MEINKIYNEDCLTFISKMDDGSIDLVITSPPYNTSNKKDSSIIDKKREEGKLEKGWQQHCNRYDIFQDQQTDEEYAEFISKIFKEIEPKLKQNGTIIWNVSYGVGDTTKINQSVWYSINSIIKNTAFTIADFIAWKKPCTTPLCCGNDLTRYCELIFVFCRKDEYETYYSNGRDSKTIKCFYTQSPNNYIETKKCNDKPNPYNRATYPSELVEKLMILYAPKKGLVYDPFMGTGTTAVGAIECGLNFIGTELSSNQINYTETRIKEVKGNSLWF